MSTISNFRNRFSYPAIDGITPSISFNDAQLLTDNQIAVEAPELNKFAGLVRTHSVVLSRASIKEIYSYATEQADPRIALRLAGARRKDNNLPVFLGLDTIEQIMFNDPDRSPTNEANLGLFTDGIRRVSVALTAALLIGKLSQLPEQFEHSKLLEERALEDLDRLVETYALNQQNATNENVSKDKIYADVFYFEIVDIDIPSDRRLVLEWYSPSLNQTWTQVTTYTGALSSWQVVVDLADSINATSVSESVEELLAVANTDGPSITSQTSLQLQSYHTLLFYPRKAVQSVIAYSINIRMRLELIPGEPPVLPDPVSPYLLNLSPIRWSPYLDSLNYFPVNGTIVILSGNTVKSATDAKTEQEYEPTVLYFRKKAGVLDIPESSKIRFRVQAWQPALILTNDEELKQNIEVDFPRLMDIDVDVQAALDSTRYSQIATTLVDAMAGITINSRIAGAIIRNDPEEIPNATAAVELISWSTAISISAIILDILFIPPDIEVAVGNVKGPKTLFSNNPKSARIPVILKNISTPSSNNLGKSALVRNKKNNYWQVIQDEAEASIYE